MGRREFARPFLAGHRPKGQGSRDAGWDTRFWPAFYLLRDLHLIEDVISVLDAPFTEGGHPVAVAGGGEDAEREFAAAMGNAATQLVGRVMTVARDYDGRDARRSLGSLQMGRSSPYGHISKRRAPIQCSAQDTWPTRR